MRRYVVTHSVEELFFTICPLGILAVALSMFFGFLMGSIDKYVPPNTSTTLRDLYEVSEASIVQFFLVHRGITEEEVHRLYGTNKYFWKLEDNLCNLNCYFLALQYALIYLGLWSKQCFLEWGKKILVSICQLLVFGLVTNPKYEVRIEPISLVDLPMSNLKHTIDVCTS